VARSVAIIQTLDDPKPSFPVPFASSQWELLEAFAAKRFPGSRRYHGTRGGSFVAAVEFEARSFAALSGGDPASSHFLDQVVGYAFGLVRPVHFWPDELKGHLTAGYHPVE
jgi:acyl-homoserine-lactone acylase